MKVVTYFSILFVFFAGGAFASLQTDVGDYDYNKNGAVDFPDFLTFASAFGQSVSSQTAQMDHDGSGKIDFADFLAFSQNFGKTYEQTSGPIPLIHAAYRFEIIEDTPQTFSDILSGLIENLNDFEPDVLALRIVSQPDSIEGVLSGSGKMYEIALTPAENYDDSTGVGFELDYGGQAPLTFNVSILMTPVDDPSVLSFGPAPTDPVAEGAHFDIEYFVSDIDDTPEVIWHSPDADLDFIPIDARHMRVKVNAQATHGEKRIDIVVRTGTSDAPIDVTGFLNFTTEDSVFVPTPKNVSLEVYHLSFHRAQNKALAVRGLAPVTVAIMNGSTTYDDAYGKLATHISNGGVLDTTWVGTITNGRLEADLPIGNLVLLFESPGYWSELDAVTVPEASTLIHKEALLPSYDEDPFKGPFAYDDDPTLIGNTAGEFGTNAPILRLGVYGGFMWEMQKGTPLTIFNPLYFSDGASNEIPFVIRSSDTGGLSESWATACRGATAQFNDMVTVAFIDSGATVSEADFSQYVTVVDTVFAPDASVPYKFVEAIPISGSISSFNAKFDGFFISGGEVKLAGTSGNVLDAFEEFTSNTAGFLSEIQWREGDYASSFAMPLFRTIPRDQVWRPNHPNDRMVTLHKLFQTTWQDQDEIPVKYTYKALPWQK